MKKPIIALAFVILAVSANAYSTALLLHPGCILLQDKWILPNTAPGLISATTASGGNCGGSYTYQWQISTDNIIFTNIPGANAQNLNYNVVTNKPLYFQRRTVCGNEIETTLSIKVDTASRLYYNVAVQDTFTKSDCTSGIGSEVIYRVPDSMYASPHSQQDANIRASVDILLNGQNYANQQGICTTVMAHMYVTNNTYEQCNVYMIEDNTNEYYDFVIQPNQSTVIPNIAPTGQYTIYMTPMPAYYYDSYFVLTVNSEPPQYTSLYYEVIFYGVTINQWNTITITR